MCVNSQREIGQKTAITMVANATLALIYPSLLAALMQANYTIFPDEKGVPYLIKVDETPLSPEEQSTLADNVNSITFSLFTRSNRQNGQNIVLDDVNSISRSYWNANRPTIFTTHGWRGAGTDGACTVARDAFLDVTDSNVIVIDWNAIANNIIYSIVAKSVASVADHVATFVNFMRVKGGLNTENMKLIGHSLGAHVASLGAQRISKFSQVAEVIALDPAKPMFEDKSPNERVDSSHARNVQVIHTCPGLLGMSGSVGTSDFFANDGKNQPGCVNDMLGSCAHGRSYEYYSESIRNPRGFLGTPKNGGSMAYMGGSPLDSRARGTYSFKTGSQPPYALAG